MSTRPEDEYHAPTQAQPPNHPDNSPNLNWLVAALFGAVFFQIAYAAVVFFAFGDMTQRGQFGDIFGGVNALFTGLALAGVIYTILLQRRELALQRDELRLNRVELTRAAQAQHHAAMSQTFQTTVNSFNDLTKYFIAHPEYKPYFYAGKKAPDEELEFERVNALAELFIDAFDSLVVHQGYTLKEYEWETWDRYAKYIYRRSPIIRRYLADHADWYPEALFLLLGVSKQVDVVVVGAGLAGLVAARDLVAAQRSVVVLEARNRVGGRVLNHTLANGAVVEVGGEWVGPTQDHVLALADELGVDLYPTYEEGDHILVLDGCTRRYSADRLALPEEVLMDVAQTQQRLQEMAAAVSLDEPWRAADALAWDAQTVDTWLAAHTSTDLGLKYWRRLVPTLFCAETTEMSLLHFLFYCKSGGMIDRLVMTSGGAQESRLVGGSQQLALQLAARLGNVVRLNAPVTDIRQVDENVEVAYDGGVVVASRAVVAIPPTLAARIRYAPALPPLRDQLTQRIPMGYVIKVQFVYPEPFWRINGLSGSVFSFDDEVTDVYDNSPQDLSCGVLLGFIVGVHARQLGKLSPNERKNLVVSRFVKFFGSQAQDFIEYVEKDWATEEWTRGCYGGYLGTGAWTIYGQALRQPIGRIHWAGTETAGVWNGYMDGAVRSGERAAQEVRIALDRAAEQRRHTPS